MRSKRIILVSHCILNQNSVLNGWERARGAYPVANLLINAGIGIVQLPCPELIRYGLNRLPRSVQEYDTIEYRMLCREMLMPYILQLCEYKENGYELAGILAVEKSPTCSMSGVRGVLMDELAMLLEENNTSLLYIEIPEDYQENGSYAGIEEKISRFIGGKTE